MKLAEKYLYQIVEEEYYGDIERIEEDYRYFLDFAAAGGFIFEDGSILEIGEGTDHRIISIEKWNQENIITYRIFNRSELNIRINSLNISYAQMSTLRELNDTYGFNNIYFDIYNNDDKLIARGEVFYLEELFSEIENAQEEAFNAGIEAADINAASLD